MRLGTLFVVAASLGVTTWAAGGCSSSSNTTGVTPDGGGGGGDGSAADGANDGPPAGNCTPACVGAHITCDPVDNKCKLDGTTTAVGAKCTMSGADPVCGTEAKATCNDQPADGFPGGYCSYEPCTTAELCPIGATCAHLGGEASACWKNCSTAADCRTPDYECLDVTPLVTSGPSKKVCFLKTFACMTNADCPAVKPTCTTPDAGAADAGAGPRGTCI